MSLGTIAAGSTAAKRRSRAVRAIPEPSPPQSGRGSCIAERIAALEQGASLDKALKAAAGDKKLLRQSLEQAEIGLKDARGYFPKGFNGEEDVADQIKGIYKIARALRKDVREALGEEED